MRKSRPRKQVQIDGDENMSMAQILREGANTEFWDVICKALDESMDVGLSNLSQDISRLPASEYKITNEINKSKVKFLHALKDLPNSYAEFLEKPAEDKPASYDPYITQEEL